MFARTACNCFPLADYIWCVSTGHGDGDNRKQNHCNCGAGEGQYDRRAPNRVLVVQIGVNATDVQNARSATRVM